MEKKLYRDDYHKKIGGVCAGLADYFNMDVTMVRLLFAIGIFLHGVTVIPYIVLMVVLPKKSRNPFAPGVDPRFGHQPYADYKVDYTVPPVNQQGQPFMYQPARSSNFGAILGAILIALGSIFLLDNFDFIPDFDYDLLWPLLLVAIGVGIIFSGKKKPWEHADAFQPEKKEADFSTKATTEPADDEKKQDDNNTSNL